MPEKTPRRLRTAAFFRMVGHHELARVHRSVEKQPDKIAFTGATANSPMPRCSPVRRRGGRADRQIWRQARRPHRLWLKNRGIHPAVFGVLGADAVLVPSTISSSRMR